jgi:hypothetical protein
MSRVEVLGSWCHTQVVTASSNAGSQPPEPFSNRLTAWLDSDQPKTLGMMGEVFAEKSFAVTIMLLMFLPALPLPTGGITHVFEVIVVLLGFQMLLGFKTIWLPERWQARELGATLTGKAIPLIAKRVGWFEKRARPRGTWLLSQGWFDRCLGLVLIAFAVGAAFAPPFSGLDTLPALGAVIVCLGVILGDLLILGAGFVIGLGGITLILTIGSAVVHLAKGVVG